MTKVLMLSTDAKILEEGSDVRARMADYAALFDSLHIVVCAKKTVSGSHEEKMKIAPNAFAYPTNSSSKLAYVRDVARIGAKIAAEQGMIAADSVVTAQDPFEIGFAGLKISRTTGLPLHVQVHTDFKSAYFNKNFLNKIRRALARRVLPRAAAVRAVSEKIKSSLPEAIAAKTSVLPIFTDVSALRSAPVTADLRAQHPRFKKIALMASRLTAEKDVSTALAAFSIALKQKVPTVAGAGFVVVGSGPLSAELQVQANALGLGDSVVFAPWAEHAKLVSYMKTCDAFVSTSLYEGYGLSMLEAHAAGATLVATDAGIAAELAGSVCAPRDAQCVATALSRAFNGDLHNREYAYPYPSKAAYLQTYKSDIERALKAAN